MLDNWPVDRRICRIYAYRIGYSDMNWVMKIHSHFSCLCLEYNEYKLMLYKVKFPFLGEFATQLHELSDHPVKDL